MAGRPAGYRPCEGFGVKQAYYKVRDIAKALGMTDSSQYKTIYRALQRRGLLVRPMALGRCWWVRVQDLRELMPEITDRLEICELRGDFSHLEEASLDSLPENGDPE